MTLSPRVVVVHRRTELDELLDRHGTRGAAEFFLRTRGRNLDEVQDRHDVIHSAMDAVMAAVPIDWRRGLVERSDLNRFLFAPDDIVVAVGQDGLVANVAKYLQRQLVLGVNPEPDINPGVLVQITVPAFGATLTLVADGKAEVEPRTMATANLDDGQRLLALNEVFIGHPSHQSARYRIETPNGGEERHSSSGVIVSTGTGATGWCRSICRERRSVVQLPQPWDASLAWFVREAWPSPATGTAYTEGLLDSEQALTLTAESDGLVAFGDGIENDHLTLSWGQKVAISIAPTSLSLVRPAA